MPFNQHQKDLIRRYLIWCYKTTKEEFDRIERYFTQLKVDAHILGKLRGSSEYKGKKPSEAYRQMVDQFEQYMQKKKANVLRKKFSDSHHTKLNPQYLYLKQRLAAIESALVHFLGKKEKERIRQAYEEEMTNRILTAREHS